jgi:uncharacterized protein (DUF697 family)
MKDAKVEVAVEPKDEPAVVEAAETVDSTDTVDATAGREERLEKLFRNHMLAAMGVGLIPIPFVDVVAIMGVQIDMIKKLSVEYDIPFQQDRGKSVVTSLVGGLLTTELGMSLSSLIKCIPIIGQTTGAVAMPVLSGASTYAIYKVFVQHFEAGGTFLDLDPAKVKSYFAEQFAKGKKVVNDMKKDKPANEAA